RSSRIRVFPPGTANRPLQLAQSILPTYQAKGGSTRMAISQMDNGAPALVSTSMVPEAPIGGAPVTAPVEVIPSGSELSDYERLRRPLPRLLLLLAPLLLFLPGAYFHPPVERMLAAATVQNAAGMGLFLTDLFIFG